MNKINTRTALNPAYRKHKPLRKNVNAFNEELINCLRTIKLSDQKGESEEHIKDPIKVFLQNTFYKENYINTKERIDMAIYTGKDANSEVGVIIEAKRPSNKAEFLSKDNLNRKALQELLLYYLRERLDNNNNNIKHLIATNGYQWFLFKGEDFYNYFYKNKELLKEYEAFRDGNKDSKKNELFYTEIAKKYITEVEKELPFVLLDFTKKKISAYSDADLNTLYKIFSDVHILGANFGNDSNQLNKTFYNELLHIIGLEEIKDKGKKIINRKAEKDRDYASILENAVFTIEDKDHLDNIKSTPRGENKAFEAGLELTLTWINRILFLKLLESQLLAYHKGANEYRFLNSDFIKGYDDLNDLFFSALAKKQNERHAKYKDRFQYIPYLNSSLFEKSELEKEAFDLTALNDEEELNIFSQTVLKDPKGKRISGKLKTLDYLFQFLEAYDFATDGTEGIEEDSENKTLINASVLGLIFEKINGYKEGSFYTPAYITMYMSRETLRRAVVQKFKEQENKQIETFEDLQAYTRRYFKKNDLQRFNKIIDSLKIVDPAVGSGHFLVSALNELISIKNDLGILIDTNGLPLQCEILIENDELYITDKLGHLLNYTPQDQEAANIQKTLFHEKQTLIENCLFGVDINPNSVKICRLRLWIELLKNAYYTDTPKHVKKIHEFSLQDTPHLQTLPNIDINIKSGNSLISRFDLDIDIKKALRGTKWTIFSYQNAVQAYKNTSDKKEKQKLTKLIEDVKTNFKTELRAKDPIYVKLAKLKNKFYDLFSGNMLFEPEAPYGKSNPEKERKQMRKQMENEIKTLETKVAEIKDSHIYTNAFEWRFEFPEVLDKNGKFLGFDVVIGNPPYVQLQSMKEISKQYAKFDFVSYASTGDLYSLFYEKGETILKQDGLLGFITGSAWMRANYGKGLRTFFNTKTNVIELIDFSDCEIFESATVLTNIMIFKKSKQKEKIKAIRFTRKNQEKIENLKAVFDAEHIMIDEFPETSWIISAQKVFDIKQKVEKQGKKIINWDIAINRGILTGFNEAFIIDTKTKEKIVKADSNSIEVLKPLLRGRDIKKYTYDYQGLWLISTFPSLNINIDDYPAIKKYLKTFGKRLNQTGKQGSRKKTSNKWFETQDNIAYWRNFGKPKIIYPNMTKFLPFVIDIDDNYFHNDKSFHLISERIFWLGAFLNSKLFRFCFEENFPELQGNSKELRKVIFEQIPIKEISKEEEQPFIEKVTKILALKKANPTADTTAIEQEIDQMVYALYALSEEEIKIVKGS